ncbi:hypothetical protein K469DRAFT_682436 [Zopfia rhizophila CBS 207.26]|uniref:Uncharacterized protein n=1 Tax=Zopfia rhizophila CBS 207.26 TaxID=1314779 RepID=A0A6A6EFM8_9PEZI|nr:hypothetical protein K469DRAFT_682436 [Zopfia rhizophila CBS 207.26]
MKDPLHNVTVDCGKIYPPDADVAGIGIVVAFLVHTTCYIFLGMIVAPAIHLYLWQITFAPGSAPRAEPDGRLTSSAIDQHRGRQRHGPQVVRQTPRSSEAIVTAFTGQYIAACAYMIVAFIKHAELSLYHLRVIHSLCSISLAVGVVSQYNRVALRWFRPAEREEGTGGRYFNMPFVAFLILLGLYWAFTIYTLIFRHSRDKNFRDCVIPNSTDALFIFLTFGTSTLLTFIKIIVWRVQSAGRGLDEPLTDSEQSRVTTWLFTFCCIIVHVGCQAAILFTIRNGLYRHQSRTNSELEFGFGQLMVLFMVFQLVVEFTKGLQADLAFLQPLTSEGMISALGLYFSVVFPILPAEIKAQVNRVWKAKLGRYANVGKRVLGGLFGQCKSLILTVTLKTTAIKQCTLIINNYKGRIGVIFRRSNKKDVDNTGAMSRTNTTNLEEGPNSTSITADNPEPNSMLPDTPLSMGITRRRTASPSRHSLEITPVNKHA